MPQDIQQFPQSVQALLEPLPTLTFNYSRKNDAAAKKILSQLTHQEVCGCNPTDHEMAVCCLSGLWLLHGFLHESHNLSQTIHRSEGSYWHGIMHRAEGDFWNSKYWYQKVGDHPVLSHLETKGITGEALVDLCEQATNNSGDRITANRFAQLEWTLLFEHCWNLATQSN